MYGLPLTGPLTYAQYVDLVLCLPRAVARKTKIVLDALRSQQSGVAPRDVYDIDAIDEKDAEAQYDTDLMRAALRRHARAR